MKQNIFEYLNIIFLILLINNTDSFSLNSMKKVNLKLANHESMIGVHQIQSEGRSNQTNICKIYEPSEINKIISDYEKDSKLNKNIHYFIYFTNKRDNFQPIISFSDLVNNAFNDTLLMNYYCEDRKKKADLDVNSDKNDKYDSGLLYVIHQGVIVKKKKIEKLSENYMDYLLKKFNLHDVLEKKADEIMKNNGKYANEVRVFLQQTQVLLSNKNKQQSFIEFDSKVGLRKHSRLDYNFNLNLIQTSISPNEFEILPQYLLQVEQSTNRLGRFIWAIVIVIILSLACFFFVKYSVDWANSSQTELNKMKMTQLDQITKEVKNKFSYILNTEA